MIILNEEKCPCENCICFSICQSKGYVNLVEQCSLISSYLINPCDMVERPIERLQKVKELLNPTFWDYKIDRRIGSNKKYSWVYHK